MAETLPSLRYQVNPYGSESGDLSGGTTNDWVDEEGTRSEERAYISYQFTASEGYAERKDDWSKEGAAIRFNYDLSENVYARKRQFVLGAYAYVLSKSLSFSGALPSGGSDAYLSGTNSPGRIKLERSLADKTYGETQVLFDDLSEGAYHRVSRQYLYPQPGIEGSSFYADVDYNCQAEVVLSGINSAYPPYLDVVAEDVVPSVTGAHPNNTFADPTEDIMLRWTMTYEQERYANFEGIDSQTSITGQVHMPLTQKSARVRWTEDGVTIHEIEVGSESQCTIPQGSITAKEFQWQVLVCTDDDVWSTDESTWYTARTDNDTVSTAEALQPKHVIIDGTAANPFQWAHYNESGTKPTGADLQYSVDGLEWSDLLSYEGRDCQCEVPANSLPSGKIYWRVRTYNVSGVAGAWSDGVQITVRSAPPTPVIVRVGRTPMPEIVWSSGEQILAEVSIDGVTERIYSAETTMIWPHILESGTYEVKVRVQNVYALWSPWAVATAEIQNILEEEFTLSAEEEENIVRLTWTNPYPQVQIFRDEKLLATVSGSLLEYEDIHSVGAHLYQLRGITDEGYYNDSNVVSAGPIVAAAVLGQAGQWITLKGRYHAPPSHTCRAQQLIHYRRYSGMKLPLAYQSKQWEFVHQFAFSLRPEELPELEKIKAFSGGSVVYKDARGDYVSGVLGEVVSVHRGLYIDVEFVITESGVSA